jgi:HD superfamily phosphohydrolase
MTDESAAPTANAIDGLLGKLRELYSKKGLSKEFDAEKEANSQILAELRRKLPPAGFELEEPRGLGSTATVWVVRHRELDQQRALKIPRPDAKLKDTVKILRGERERLAAVNHQNVIRIYGSGEVECEVAKQPYLLPYFIMEYFDKVEDFDEAIVRNRKKLTDAALIAYFRDALTGISVLHGEDIVHCDIKPGNLLIAPEKPALVTDLGYAKIINATISDQLTEVRFTERYAHPDLVDLVINRADPNAVIAPVPRMKLRKVFDLYAFGRTMQEVLHQLRTAEEQDAKAGGGLKSVFSAYQWAYLSMISKRLLDGRVDRRTGPELQTDIISGLGEREMAEISYNSAIEALEDFEKLLHLYDLESKVPELNEHISQYIQIPHCHVPLTSRVRAVVEHPAFVRLGQVTQLGFISSVYPGARHTRLEHVYGTFTHCCSYARALWYDQDNCLFQCIMSKSEIERLLVAALVHDIAQYPMAHDLTEAASEFEHEQYTEDILRRLYSGTEHSLGQIIESEWQFDDIDYVLRILHITENSTLRDRILHSVIDGPIDCDKMDYLRRDSTHLGVNFGHGIDQERLVRNLTVVYRSKPQRGENNEIQDVLEFAELGVREKALVVASSLGQSRRDMFTQVYWQHTARCMKAMLAYAVRRILIGRTEAELASLWEDFYDRIFDPMFCRGTSTSAASGPTGRPKSKPRADQSLDDDFLTATTHEASSVAVASPELVSTDDALLLFLLDFAKGPEGQVLNLLRSRRLYRRVAVLTGPQALEVRGDGEQEEHKNLYKNIYEQFRNHRLDGNLRKIEELREKWEKNMVEKLSGKVSTEDKSSLSAATAPLILVDVPLKATRRTDGGSAGVRYLTEDSLGVHAGGKAVSSPKFESSRVILDNEDFDKQVGKIRVFAHPSFRELIVANLTRDEILSCLKS